MKKRSLCLILIFLICFSLTSCKNYNKVKPGKKENTLIYDENVYYEPPHNYWSCLSAYHDGKLTQIAWRWYIPLLGKFTFFSDTEKKPDFIFCARNRSVWINENYDYKSKKFTIIGSELNFCFEEAYINDPIENLPENAEKAAEFKWYPENHEALINSPIIYKCDDGYFINFDEFNKEPYYPVENEFLSALKDSDIITES